MMERPDEVPPPPYSETDIYSASAISRSRPSPAGQNADDASIAASLSHSNIIYTPSETPQDAPYNWAAAGADCLPRSSSASAQAYLASRPAAGRPPSAYIVHAIHFAEDMMPVDLPYPDWSPGRQITEQDWHTFVNHLLPGHAERANEYIADHKLRAEKEAAPSEAGQDIAGAQLDQIQKPADASRRGWGFEPALQTVHDWNEGFFVPRGVTLRLDPPPDFPGRPRAWDQAAFGSTRELPQRPGRGMRAGPIFGTMRGGRGVHGRPGHHEYHEAEHGHRGHGRGRGRYLGGPRREGCANRSRSRSSASSHPSSSSSGSESSIGSLPDWDELSDSQLPVVRSSVLNWIHSGQPVSRVEYKRVRDEIKAAEGMPVSCQAGSADQRKDVKLLLAHWKESKKSQKTARKAAKKERRARRRERRAERKETRRNRREHRQVERDAPKASPGSASQSPHGPPEAVGPGAFGFVPRRAGGPRLYGLFGGGRGGRASGGSSPHPPGSWPSSSSSVDRAQQACEEGAAAAAAADAVRRAHAVRDAALDNVRKQGAEATTRAHAALRNVEASRRGAQETADRGLKQGAEAVTRAHAVRNAALRNAEASRRGAQGAADRARDEAMRHRTQGHENARQQGPPWRRWQGAGQTHARLGREIDELENKLQALGMEPDEALTKQLADEEKGGWHPS